MVEFKAYENALTYLNEAISISKSMPKAAYPNVAVSAKIDALRGLKRYSEALALCAEAIRPADHLQYLNMNINRPLASDMRRK